MGALPAAKKGTVLVDMTTSEPSLGGEISEVAAAKSMPSMPRFPAAT